QRQYGLPGVIWNMNEFIRALSSVVHRRLPWPANLSSHFIRLAGSKMIGNSGAERLTGLQATKMPRIENHENLGAPRTAAALDTVDLMTGIALGQQRGQGIQQDGQARALPVAGRQQSPSGSNHAGVAAETPLLIEAPIHR